MSNLAVSKVQKRSWGEWFYQVRVPIILLSCVAVFFLGLFYYQATKVSGIEINVRDWSVREFSLRRDPFTGTQLYGIRYSSEVYEGLAWDEIPESLKCDLSGSIRTHLNLQTNQADRWDLILLEPGRQEGDAKILFDLLNAYDSNYDCFWVSWSDDHKKEAAIFWPAAQDLVNLKFYSLLPGLFQLALPSGDDYDLKAAIDDYMTDQIAAQCKLLLKAGLESKCQESAKVGLAYGDSEQLLQYVEN